MLAVCIDEPKPSDPYNDRFRLLDRYGLADWRHGYPAFYWKGPFLKFLQDRARARAGCNRPAGELRNESDGLKMDAGPNLTAEERRKYGLEFEFDGKTTWWLGDGNVFGWHRFFRCMALLSNVR